MPKKWETLIYTDVQASKWKQTTTNTVLSLKQIYSINTMASSSICEISFNDSTRKKIITKSVTVKKKQNQTGIMIFDIIPN